MRISTFFRLRIITPVLLVLLIVSLAILVANRQQNPQGSAAGSPVLTATATGSTGSVASTGTAIHTPTVSSKTTQHYEYIFPDGGMYVYDMDNGHRLVKNIQLPTTAGVRGVVASPATHMLYISYGGDWRLQWEWINVEV